MSMIFHLTKATDAQIEQLVINPEGIHDFLSAKRSNTLDLDKAWHGIHFLLTGTNGFQEDCEENSGPRHYLLHGGRPIGEIDVGYGPAKAISSAETKKFAEVLNAETVESLKRQYDPEVMADEQVYPNVWDDGDDEFDYLMSHYKDLREYVVEASKEGKGLVMHMD
jgi:hypothetical protein